MSGLMSKCKKVFVAGFTKVADYYVYFVFVSKYF